MLTKNWGHLISSSHPGGSHFPRITIAELCLSFLSVGVGKQRISFHMLLIGSLTNLFEIADKITMVC